MNMARPRNGHETGINSTAFTSGHETQPMPSMESPTSPPPNGQDNIITVTEIVHESPTIASMESPTSPPPETQDLNSKIPNSGHETSTLPSMETLTSTSSPPEYQYGDNTVSVSSQETSALPSMKSPTSFPPDMELTISSNCNEVSTPPELEMTLLSPSLILSDNNTTSERNMTSTAMSPHPVQITSRQENTRITSSPLYDNEDNQELEDNPRMKDNPKMKDNQKSEDNSIEPAKKYIKTNKKLHLLPPSNKDNPNLKTTMKSKNKNNSRTKRSKPSAIQKHNIKKYFFVKKSDNTDGQTEVPITDE